MDNIFTVAWHGDTALKDEIENDLLHNNAAIQKILADYHMPHVFESHAALTQMR